MSLRPSRVRRLLPIAALLVLTGLAAGWYLHRRNATDLADRALSDIPTDEYEQWMQELGYTD